MNLQKNKFWRSQEYLAWVRTQQCTECPSQDTKSEAHHIIGVGGLSGMGMKAPDWATMAVCKRCHDAIHENPDRWDQQWEMIVRTLGSAIDEGILTEHLIPF